VYFIKSVMESFSSSFNNIYLTDCSSNVKYCKDFFFPLVQCPCVNGIYATVWIFIMTSRILYQQGTINHLWMTHAVYISKLLHTIHFWNALCSCDIFSICSFFLIKMPHSICQLYWKTQQWPQDWKRSVFIPIPKKGNAKKCSKPLHNCYSSHTLLK